MWNVRSARFPHANGRLRYFLQCDTRETAIALGVSEGTVKNSLAKARAALATALGDEGDPDELEVTTDGGRR